MKGTVKWYDPTKGFGFIQPEDGGGDVFVHRSALWRSQIQTLEPGQSVEFDREKSKNGKGDQAANLRLE